MSEARTTITGNITQAPEVRFTASGHVVANFTVVENRRKRDASGAWVDAEPLFMRVTAWKGLAENVGASCVKGTRVTVEGRLTPTSWTAEDGSTRHALELTADDVAISLQFAAATVHRNPRPGSASVSTNPTELVSSVLGGVPVGA